MLAAAAPELAVQVTVILGAITALVGAVHRWITGPLLSETRKLTELRGRLERTLAAVNHGVEGMQRVQRSQDDELAAVRTAVDGHAHWRDEHHRSHDLIDRRLADLERRAS